MNQRLAIIALALSLPATACATAVVGGAAAVGVAAAQDRTVGTAVDDATNSSQIKGMMLRENRAAFQEVDVEVVDGLVLLSGRVDRPEDRTRAEGIAWQSTRTRDVANEIKIEGAGGWLANLSDEIITGRVRSRLIGSSSVRSLNVNVETYDGVVYLMGTARTQDELRKIAEEASVVGGVQQVVSYVRLTGTSTLAAAPIRQR